LDESVVDEGILTVMLVDDHALMRAGVKRLLEDTGKIAVIAEASDGQQAIRECKKIKADVIILDISLPDTNGLETCKQIKAILPDAKILILTMHPEKLFAARSIRSGALGYITKNIDSPNELYQAIQKVAKGEVYLSNETAGSVVSQLGKTHKNNSQIDLLSDRELQVLSLLAHGKKRKEIAAILGLSPSTIQNYRSRAMEKLGLHENTDLFEIARQSDLF
jgi:DNA-binding NarL/FixJ family response regulator